MATAGDARGAGPERAYHPSLASADEVTLDAAESLHLVRSRRVRQGEPVVLFDGRGHLVQGVLVTADLKAAVVRVEGPYPAREPVRDVALCVSFPEAGRADAMVSALAELGVVRVVPMTCARTPRGRHDAVPRRRARWMRLVREATKVSGGCRFLEIADVASMTDCLARAPDAGLAIADPDPAARPLADLVRAGPVSRLLIGPEGGFTDQEIDAARAAGCAPVSIGRTALRIETAAVAGAAILLG